MLCQADVVFLIGVGPFGLGLSQTGIARPRVAPCKDGPPSPPCPANSAIHHTRQTENECQQNSESPRGAARALIRLITNVCSDAF